MGEIDKAKWLGAVNGSASEANARAREDSAQRREAAKRTGENAVILSQKDILNGKWDSGSLLQTTIGGKLRALTANDLVAFKENIKKAQNKVSKGITTKQIIDFSSVKPDTVKNTDLHLAMTEIKQATATSAAKGRVRFITNASGKSKETRHHVVVEFLDYGREASSGALTARKSALKMRRGALKIECDCGKWRYWYRYIASIGGYNAGRLETGFPKVKNPQLTGIACKHIVRVAAEIDKNSGSIVMFLERLMDKAKKSDTGKASIRTTQKQAERTFKNQAKRTTGNKIKTSTEKKLRNAKKPKKITRNSSVANATDAILINELISRGILPESARIE